MPRCSRCRPSGSAMDTTAGWIRRPAGGGPVTRYVRLWRELLGLSARRLPVLTAVMAGALILNTIVPAAALALRATVDPSVRHSVRAAVTGAVGVGLVYC